MLAARYRRRRPACPPAAATHTCHASVRETSATSCSAVATRRITIGAASSAAPNSCRRLATTKPRAPVATRAPTSVVSTRRRLHGDGHGGAGTADSSRCDGGDQVALLTARADVRLDSLDTRVPPRASLLCVTGWVIRDP